MTQTARPSAEEYFRPLFPLAGELDPTRPVGFVNVMLAPYGKCRVSLRRRWRKEA